MAPLIGRFPTTDQGLEKIAVELNAALEKMEGVNADGAAQAMREILKRLPGAVDRLCLVMYWQRVVAMCLILIFGCAISFMTGFWVRGPEPWRIVCQPNGSSGELICTGWVPLNP
jgi:hypothetical protein